MSHTANVGAGYLASARAKSAGGLCVSVIIPTRNRAELYPLAAAFLSMINVYANRKIPEKRNSWEQNLRREPTRTGALRIGYCRELRSDALPF